MKIPRCDGSASDCNRTYDEYCKQLRMWKEMKAQMQYERESAYESVSYSKSYARLEDTLFNQGQYEAFKKVQAIMDKLEKS